MLIQATMTCGRCKQDFFNCVQFSEFTCRRCGTTATLCPECAALKCQWCRGVLETEQDRAERMGIVIMY